ncbi:hypothetical protein KW782_04645 [Candidatus Parcubacteria bacterium]|nr:hypothetical protein [Candidatus Parcubacteria bacterium]
MTESSTTNFPRRRGRPPKKVVAPQKEICFYQHGGFNPVRLLPEDWEAAYQKLGVTGVEGRSGASGWWIVKTPTELRPHMFTSVFEQLGVQAQWIWVDPSTVTDVHLPDAVCGRMFPSLTDPDLDQAGIPACCFTEGRSPITLVEHLLLHLVYFLKTGRHLDVEGETMCAGSRCVGVRPDILGVPAVSTKLWANTTTLYIRQISEIYSTLFTRARIAYHYTGF